MNCEFGCGTVFKLAPDGALTDLHDFDSGSDGSNPAEHLIFDQAGDLFGTTSGDGDSTLGLSELQLLRLRLTKREGSGREVRARASGTQESPNRA